MFDPGDGLGPARNCGHGRGLGGVQQELGGEGGGKPRATGGLKAAKVLVYTELFQSPTDDGHFDKDGSKWMVFHTETTSDGWYLLTVTMTC